MYLDSCGSGVLGAYLNVKINAVGFFDTSYLEKVLSEAEEIAKNTEAFEKEILKIVEEKIG